MNSLSPEDIKIVRGLPPVAQKSDRVAIDTEWFHMEKERLHRPHGDHACTTFCFDGVTVYVVENETFLTLAMRNVEPAVHVFHNSKFDIQQLRRFVTYPHRSTMWDTMLVEQIRFAGYYAAGEYSLADLSRRYLKLYMDKSVREQFVMMDELTPEMLDYSAMDCAATWRIFKAQLAEVSATELKLWKEVECPYLFAVTTFTGFMMDVPQWKEVTERHRKLAEDIQAKYGQQVMKIGPRGGKKTEWTGLNLNSPQQVLKEVNKQLKALGIQMENKSGQLVPAKVTSTNEDDIQEFADRVPFIADLLAYREHEKEASTYGAVLEFVESDGRIWPDIRQMGAATGRLSMQKPNGQNIPNTEERRSCVIPDGAYDGVFVDGDYSAQEPRIFAHLCGDPAMRDIFKLHKDIYIEFARLGFNETITKADKERRSEMKTTVLGASYGLTCVGMQRKSGIPIDRGKMLLDTFWNTFPGAKRYRSYIIDFGRKHEYVETIMGRRYWLNVYQFGWENNCMNSPVQGSAADAIKVATIKFLDAWGWPDTAPYLSPIVNEAHDEILLEVPYMMANAAAQVLEGAMLDTASQMHPDIPAEVEIKPPGRNWADVH